MYATSSWRSISRVKSFLVQSASTSLASTMIEFTLHPLLLYRHNSLPPLTFNLLLPYSAQSHLILPSSSRISSFALTDSATSPYTHELRIKIPNNTTTPTPDTVLTILPIQTGQYITLTDILSGLSNHLHTQISQESFHALPIHIRERAVRTFRSRTSASSLSSGIVRLDCLGFTGNVYFAGLSSVPDPVSGAYDVYLAAGTSSS